MKKIFLFASLILGGVSIAQAQINEGNVLLGTNLANLQVDFDAKTSFGITPKAAWFIKDGVAVGGYGKFNFDHTHGADGNSYTYGIGALGRYYASADQVPAFRQTKFFVEGTVGFEGSNNTVLNKSTNGLGFGVGPGVSYFITPTVGLEALLKYDGVVGFGSDAYKQGISFAVGFQVYLPSKKLINKAKSF